MYWFVLLARVILSWIGHRLPDGFRPISGFVFTLTEPVLRIFRPLMPPVRIGTAALDVSMLLVFLLLGIVQSAVCGGV